jgi:hypothetical protein
VLAGIVGLFVVFLVVRYRTTTPRVTITPIIRTLRIAVGSKSGRVSRIAIGVNNAVWDPHLSDSGVPDVLSDVGAKILRFPGGTTSDVYHWQTNSITPRQPGFAEPKNTFDNWMSNIVQRSGAQAMVTVNYGTNAAGTGGGDPTEAAAWVNYANNQMGYGVKYWEIGNEVYGNGYYGTAWNWEADLHTDKSPAAYAAGIRAYSLAMKNVDPTIKIGASLVVPGVPPDGAGPEPWNATVLSHACDAIDFVSVHWYPELPGKETDARLLASTEAIPGAMHRLHELIRRYCGTRAQHIQIMVTETNSVAFNPGKQTTSGVSALYLAADYLSWLRAGASNVDWWDLHDGPDPHGNLSPQILGTARYGDFGLVSSGGLGEPPLETPVPAYTALGMISSVVKQGARFGRVTERKGPIQAFALMRPHSIDLVLINTSTIRPGHLTLDLPRAPSLPNAKVTTYSALDLIRAVASQRIAPSRIRYTLPPYTLALLAIPTR